MEVRDWFATAFPFNFNDLNGPVPASAYLHCIPGWQIGINTKIVQEWYQPQLAVPEAIKKMHPGWQDCDLDLDGSYDPPTALGYAQVIADPTTGPGITMTAEPAVTVTMSVPVKTDAPKPPIPTQTNKPGDAVPGRPPTGDVDTTHIAPIATSDPPVVHYWDPGQLASKTIGIGDFIFSGEVVSIDPTAGVVVISNAGEQSTVTFPSDPRPGGNPNHNPNDSLPKPQNNPELTAKIGPHDILIDPSTPTVITISNNDSNSNHIVTISPHHAIMAEGLTISASSDTVIIANHETTVTITIPSSNESAASGSSYATLSASIPSIAIEPAPTPIATFGSSSRTILVSIIPGNVASLAIGDQTLALAAGLSTEVSGITIIDQNGILTMEQGGSTELITLPGHTQTKSIETRTTLAGSRSTSLNSSESGSGSSGLAQSTSKINGGSNIRSVSKIIPTNMILIGSVVALWWCA
jgi:hypothetical protein